MASKTFTCKLFALKNKPLAHSQLYNIAIYSKINFAHDIPYIFPSEISAARVCHILAQKLYVHLFIPTQWFTTSKCPLGVIGEAVFGCVPYVRLSDFRSLPASPILGLLRRYLAGITVLAHRWLLESSLEFDLKGQCQRKN